MSVSHIVTLNGVVITQTSPPIFIVAAAYCHNLCK